MSRSTGSRTVATLAAAELASTACVTTTAGDGRSWPLPSGRRTSSDEGASR